MLKFKYKTLLSLIILLCITLFIINPSSLMQSSLQGGKVWLFNVFPALFPFFILTRIIISLNQSSIPILDRFTTKCFNTNNAGLIYFLSMLSGYPVGAKIIGSYYESGAIDKSTAVKMCSFCSTSGPMFIIGTVGIGIFRNSMIGYILLLGHIIGGFLNGLLYRKKVSSNNQFTASLTKTSLNEIVYDSIISILMVGGYIVFASVLIKLLTITNILPTLTQLIIKFIPCFDYNITYAFLCSLLEITNGLILLGGCAVGTKIKIILSSIIIAFSGVCIILQSMGFLNKVGIKKSTIILQKTTQSLLTALSTVALTLVAC